jgi:methylglutaconyl-CoA hydratase
MEKSVLAAVEGRSLILSLNRPEKRNALSPQLVHELKEALQAHENMPEIRMVVIKSNGPAFCAGADLDYIKSMSNFSFEDNLFDSGALAKLFEMIYKYPKPVIAQVEGPALAGGCGLAAVCDYVLATPTSTFGYTEVRIGFIPAIVSVFLSRKIGEGKTRELLLSGRIITAEEALQLGIINKIVPPEQMETEVNSLTEKWSRECSGDAIARTKALLAGIQERGLKDGLDFASEMNANARASADCKTGISAFLDKKKISW